MAKLLKLRRGTTTQHGSFTGAEGEVTVDTDKETLVVHDGSTAGGHPVAAEDMANVSSSAIAGRLSNDSLATSKLAAGSLPSDVTVASANLVDGTIVNADVNASAAIAGTKISPDFGSQTITTTGQCNTGDLSITGTAPSLVLQDSNDENDFAVANNGGLFKVRDVDAGVDRFTITSAGVTGVSGNLDVGAGVDVTGDINATGDINGQGDIVINSSGPKISLNDTGQNPDYDILNTDGVFQVNDTTNSAVRFRINTDGHVDFLTNVDFGAGIDVTGDITVSGNVDGADVAAMNTKLSGIETAATADQTAAEIRTLVESASDSNVFTDADHSKLNGIEA